MAAIALSTPLTVAVLKLGRRSMISKYITLAALATGLFAAATPAAAIINAPVPTTNYITFGGNDWAWASPCPPSGSAGGTQCGTPNTVDFTYQATQGWRLPTAAELAAGPTVADFGTAGNFKCASAWFNTVYTHCDYGDAASGAVYGSAGGGNWYDETWVIRGVPEPTTWLLMIAGFGLVGTSMRNRKRAGSLAC